MNGTVVIVTGGMDPCHSGHVSYLNDAKKLGDILVVGLNSDDWLIRKKGFRFMPWEERAEIVRNFRCVDYVFRFDDKDGSACDAIRKMSLRYPLHNLIFANGGDRTNVNIPEMRLKDGEHWYGEHFAKRLAFVFGVGGDSKQNSSSDILKEYRDYVIKQFNGSQKWMPKNYDKSSSVSSVSKTSDSSQDLSMARARFSDEDSFVRVDGQERDEILYSSKRFYSDIYDYPTWGSGTKQGKD